MSRLPTKPASLVQAQALLARWLPSRRAMPRAEVSLDRSEAGSEKTHLLPDPINQKTLATLRHIGRRAGRDLVNVLLQRFLETAEERLQQIEEAIRVGNAQRFGEVAHALKSSTAIVGAEILSDYYRQIENVGRQGRIDAARALLPQLRLEQQRVVLRVRALLQQTT